jgi:uncharacterized membrane protein YdbT with pleckstrin-like domain
MSEKMFEGQHDDESVVYTFRRFPIVMRKGILGLGLFWIGGLLPFSIWFDQRWAVYVLVAGLGLGGLVMFLSWVSWYFTLHIVTDQRFIQITQEGLFKRTVVDIGLDKIQNINYQVAGFQEAVLGFGTIVIQTFVGDLVIKYVHKPARVQAQLIRTIKENGFEYRGEEAQI